MIQFYVYIYIYIYILFLIIIIFYFIQVWLIYNDVLISAVQQSDSDVQRDTIAQLVKNPPAMQETPGWFLGWEDPLQKGKATHSSILAWRIPWAV